MTTSPPATAPVRTGPPAPGPPAGPGARPRAARLVLSLLVVVALPVSVVAASLFGSADLGPADVLGTLLRHLGLGDLAPAPALPGLLDALVWESRFPRVLLAAAVGAGLAVSGAVLQAVTRNPLADPYLLGVSSGASTGAVAVLLLGVGGSVSLSTGAFAGGLASLGLLLLLLGGGRVASPARVVLTGVLVSQFFAAVTSVVLMVSGDANATRGFTYWLLGTLGGARWEGTAVTCVVVLAGIVAVQFSARSLDAFTFGRDAAAALGVNVTATRVRLLVLASVITAAAVAASGAIGFVGLLVPHAVRVLAGPGHRTLLPLSAAVGAVFLIWVDVFARTAFNPHELPAGVITALLGAPAFALVLKRLES
ncbi:iron chelate uptake ABC transporter family permease subunit [Streptomyces sp. NPDC097619]|uniref:FecCD family ABC transporter permease n=1 Tax=Streptomyces sp. NPDC097619 TaxID=3157228 RepID=UPI00331EBAE8